MTREQVIALVNKSKQTIQDMIRKRVEQASILSINPVQAEINAMTEILNDLVFRNLDAALSKLSIRGVVNQLHRLMTRAEEENQSAINELWGALTV